MACRAAQYRIISRCFTTSQLEALGTFLSLDHEVAGRTKVVGLPFRLRGAPVEIVRTPPTLGRDTEAVLREHGYDDTGDSCAHRSRHHRPRIRGGAIGLISMSYPIAIVGIGKTAQGTLPGATPLGLQIAAVKAALDDSGLDKSEIDGLLTQPGTTAPEGAYNYLRLGRGSGAFAALRRVVRDGRRDLLGQPANGKPRGILRRREGGRVRIRRYRALRRVEIRPGGGMGRFLGDLGHVFGGRQQRHDCAAPHA